MNAKPNIGDRWGHSLRRAVWAVLLGLVALGLLFGSELLRLVTDWFWFQDVGYREIFVRTTLIKAGLMVGATALFFVVIYSNLMVAQQWKPRPHLYLDDEHQLRVTLSRIGRRWLSVILLLITLMVSLTVGMGAANGWYDYLLFTNPVAFGKSDAIFGRDVGFYVFTYPFLAFIYRWLIVAVGLSFFGALSLYWVDKDLDFVGNRVRLAPHARVHLSVLLGVGLLIKAWGYWLGRYEMLFSQHRLFFGAGYTDVHVRLVVLNVLTVIAVVAALVLFANIYFRGVRLPLTVIGAWLVVSFVGGAMLPGMVQKFRVTPNELEAEEPFIKNSIEATRDAYNLTKIHPRSFSASGRLSMADIERKSDMVRSIRLWDYGPLLDAYRQIQTIRTYYTFKGADVDRYRFADGVRQVAVSVRELDVNQLGGAESSWINRHLIYTHGYGLCMSPVDRAAEGGLPELIIKDFPPQTPPELSLTRPQIYYGELTDNYVIVNSTEKEFDYPAGDQNMTTRYEGDRGVAIGSLMRRVLFALRFGDVNILLSRHLTNESRILYSRNIVERAQRIAPFLRLDGDPYPVVHDGRVVWILDAYTVTRWYPYAQHVLTEPRPYGRPLNYMRNSVKITIDAYDGTATFYLADENEPIALALRKAFPGFMRPLSEMPADLRSHLRYPKDLFDFQAAIYTSYHMTEPRVFYNREDMWQIPKLRPDTQDSFGLRQQGDLMAPYYVMMNLPEAQKTEYLLMLPFTPAGDKQNMIGWMAARCDQEHLGELVVYNFPKQKLIYGPAQIDALINQHPEISKSLSLWDQIGSKVIRAPVMVIPFGESILYIEPLYLQSNSSKMPELKKVFVAYNGQVEMADTLAQGLALVFGGSAERIAQATGATPAVTTTTSGDAPAADAASTSPEPTPAGAIPAEVQRLVREADAHYRRAEAAQRQGDWDNYGTEMKNLRRALDALRRATGE